MSQEQRRLLRTSRTNFLYFFRSETPSRIRTRPRCYPPGRGARPVHVPDNACADANNVGHVHIHHLRRRPRSRRRTRSSPPAVARCRSAALLLRPVLMYTWGARHRTPSTPVIECFECAVSRPDMAIDRRLARRRRTVLCMLAAQALSARNRANSDRSMSPTRAMFPPVESIWSWLALGGLTCHQNASASSDFDSCDAFSSELPRQLMRQLSGGRGQHHVVGVHLNCCHLAVDGRPERPVPLV